MGSGGSETSPPGAHVKRARVYVSYQKLFLEELGRMHAFVFLSSVLISVCSLEFVGNGFPSLGALALSTFRGVSPFRGVALPQPLPESSACILVCGRWDPSLGHFHDFMFCQHKFR